MARNPQLLRALIEDELKKLARLEQSFQQIEAKLALPPDGVPDYDRGAIGYLLHSFYNGCENIFRAIARFFENDLGADSCLDRAGRFRREARHLILCGPPERDPYLGLVRFFCPREFCQPLRPFPSEPKLSTAPDSGLRRRLRAWRESHRFALYARANQRDISSMERMVTPRLLTVPISKPDRISFNSGRSRMSRAGGPGQIPSCPIGAWARI
ncbi:MAG: hypothetical protein VBE63_06200 [Lamprobacter sp.]|uniref:hypothetical protein n=1 Tax=Lamprobacter sp. TaxID=3100796 RepID=UPI002B25FBD0|nr:hypothetical protein [Lamprobacter sp.]MEA3639518.1 hypothetical protein [Lamprobacter sp.]